MFKWLKNKKSSNKYANGGHIFIMQAGQKYVDKEWGDTIIQIKAINKAGTHCRYVFLQIDGKTVPESCLHSLSIESILENYELFN